MTPYVQDSYQALLVLADEESKPGDVAGAAGTLLTTALAVLFTLGTTDAQRAEMFRAVRDHVDTAYRSAIEVHASWDARQEVQG